MSEMEKRRTLWDCQDELDDGALDPQFRLNRDSPDRAEVRDFVDALWQRYAPFCGDPGFEGRFKRQFNALSWQMYIGVCLLEAGLDVERPAPDEPDHKARFKGRRLWVECIAPGAGTGKNEAKRTFAKVMPDSGSYSGLYRPPPDDDIALRLTGAIWEKRKQHLKRREAGIVADEDYYVVAIGAGSIPDADLEREIPQIVKILYGLDDPAFRYEIYSENREVEIVPTYRDEIDRDRGKPVSRRGFLDGHLPEVSAVLFGARGVWNPPRTLGRDLITVHNPTANCPLEHGWLGLGREYWPSDRLELIDHGE